MYSFNSNIALKKNVVTLCKTVDSGKKTGQDGLEKIKVKDCTLLTATAALKMALAC